MKFFNLKWAMMLLVASFAFVSCSDDDDDNAKTVTGKDMWGEVLRGDDMKLQFYPDHFAFYWEYTFNAAENPDLGLIVEGEYPDSRFLSYNVYDDDAQTSYVEEQGKNFSLMDTQIVPEAGSVNPFNGGAWKAGQKYTVYILPTNAPASYVQGKSNVIWFDAAAKKICTILRYYIPQGDGVRGSVGMPLVKAIDLKSGKEVDAPKRELSGLRGAMEIPNATFQSNERMNFFRAPFAYAYPNGPAEYCYSRNTLEQEEVMFFNFKAPSYPKNADEFGSVDMRYWSVCVGNDETYTPLAISDYQTKLDANGFANYVLADINGANFEAIKNIAEKNNYNLLPWDGQKWHKGVMVLYRNMVFADNYVHSMRQLTPVDGTVNPMDIVANPQKYIAIAALGPWGAFGVKVPAQQFVGAQGMIPLRQQPQQ